MCGSLQGTTPPPTMWPWEAAGIGQGVFWGEGGNPPLWGYLCLLDDEHAS